ncbi:hypothetical protein C2845_PM02G17830 [Panicum miliaceum]|uniref:F-box domain-containing protein n=1 Tax=Panicum miliaceum TaxID=4540 RepID=A0A3L6S6U4_PANMI|nr:hypothetical protein C2845_PM02G17830 [Panicum miliaceum]
MSAPVCQQHGEEGVMVPVTMSEPHRRPASPEQPGNDDVLHGIFLLPPLLSSLMRASTVCKPWLHLISDPAFGCRFRDQHGIPPLFGFFDDGPFVSTMDLPESRPQPGSALSEPKLQGNDYMTLGCRHGLVVLLSHGSHCCVPFPLRATLASGGALLRADGNDGM